MKLRELEISLQKYFFKKVVTHPFNLYVARLHGPKACEKN